MVTSKPQPMRVVQTVFGVFHHFELAHQLEQRRLLHKVYSTWSWTRLKREGIAREKVETYPWLHMAEYGAHAYLPVGKHWVTDHLGYANALAFDRWTERRLAKELRRGVRVDALIALAGSSLSTGAMLQREGCVYICDRGSTHQRYQERLVREEYERWGLRYSLSDERDSAREDAIYEQADAITVPSSAALRSFLEMGVPAEKMHRIPYGVRLEKFKPTAEPPPDEFCVLFAGYAGLRKGVPYLLEAFAALQHPRKVLRIAGDIQDDLRGLMGRMPMDRVEMLGSLAQAEMASLMSRSHVLVLPSIEDGFGLVMSEAMACGCPVISSVNTGGEDLFTDGVEGFIVPIRDVNALRDKMQELADDPERQKQMREAALERVRLLGGWSDYGDRWQALLERLVPRKD
jgi:starch synthase